ncbi:hypothetical protein [Desulfopila sp. IMCC35008]|uniref:hypothetical protein n=1 Tax=Desulfopila sp. IMCC35008 TaxID=2653858 RepID=UPI0013D797B3|nr:hypothetical protein [Desulfopila sp. IMCC35008]
MRQVLGSFKVIDQNRITMQVTLSQESHIDVNGVVVSHKKVFNIDDETGEELIPTRDPNILLRQDGSQLKKIGPVNTGTLPNVPNSHVRYK